MRRHRDKKRRSRLHRPAPQTSATNDPLGMTLDALNAWGYLEEWHEKRLDQINTFGPGVFRGYLPIIWAGVILWYKQRGYYHYSALSMLGIWAYYDAAELVHVTVGTKTVPYALSHFNAEAYYRRIQTEFKTFYQDTGAPPPETQRRYTICYDPAQRLAIRQEIRDVLAAWAKEHH